MPRGGIAHNADEITRKLLLRSQAMRSEQERAAHEIGKVVSEEAKAVLRRKVYSVRVRWKRSGDLLRAETFQVRGVDAILVNDTPYAADRLALGTSRGREIKTPGVQSVQWQAEAARNKRRDVLRIRREAQLRALRRG